MTNPYRLPTSVRPSAYRIRIEPDLDAASFVGEVEIDVEVDADTDHVLLNALDLEIGSAMVVQSGADIPAVVESLPDEQRIRLLAPMGAGAATLKLSFSGVLNDLLVGFYRSTYVDGDGVEQVIATTQFEATDARRAFPCFDEPIFKATFAVTLVVPSHLFALSNYPEIRRTAMDVGRVEVEFARSMKMSSYLVAFAVGPFEATEPRIVNGVPLRVVAPRGRLHLADYALDCAAAILEYFTNYYGIPYPGEKLDHVAIPDFAFGAMENLGCITYRETTLLVDPSTAGQADLVRVLDVIGHEMAHMWFGDLVTMEWWDGIWLNEAFAMFMEMKSTDAIRPEWKRRLSFAGDERPWAYGVDSLHSTRPVEFEVRSPEEANEMFDALTYGKGSAVLWMMEQYMGEEVFQAGVRSYLKRHAYSNTVTEDLWRSLDAEAGLGVVEAMKTWIHQGGYPMLDVTVDGSQVRLSQSRFLAIPDESDTTTWHLPVVVRGEAGGREFQEHVMLTGADGSLHLDAPVDWALGNVGGHGYYRVQYRGENLARIMERLDRLDAVERFCLLDDTWALVENGSLGVAEFLDLATRYGSESELTIVQRLVQTVGKVSHHLVTEDARPAFRRWAGSLFRPSFDRLRWEVDPGDSGLVRRMRGLLISALGKLAEDPEVLERARQIGVAWLARAPRVDPDVGQACLLLAVAGGEDGVWKRLRSAHDAANDPQWKAKILHAMTASENADEVESVFASLLDGWVKSQDVGWMVGALLGGRRTGDVAWRLLRAGWPEIYPKMPGLTIARALEGLPALSAEELAADVRGFFAETKVATAGKALAQNLERLEVNVRLRAAQTGATSDYFA